ncbi:MAG TPA: discoidin domain-containing protein [Flavobacterium sp.]|uniref:discoidin domain-containing protein n=1 Tax=Flavobacterium sp. TaxID=239 RepID=UPI002DB7D4B3|nr:discoidin domain-containing protein [Flavobacterium sp.]HEU4790185.1 discoidin domain-containing protein [Flavobacterium sp.]
MRKLYLIPALVLLMCNQISMAQSKNNSIGKTKWFDPNKPASTYCNPINIGYNYTTANHNGIPDSRRSSADPLIIAYKGDYYLFATNQAGFFWSKDLSDWKFVYGSFQRNPGDDDQCAPAAWVVNDTLFYVGSTWKKDHPVWKTADPKSGRWVRHVNTAMLPTWDPAIFQDDDKKVYMYYGSSGKLPLCGVEVDYKTWLPKGNQADYEKLYAATEVEDIQRPYGEIKAVADLDPSLHGWERFGPNNDMEPAPWGNFIEGAWMTKHNGKYYMQYGAPATEFKGYANGVHVGNSPLGPFTYQKHNPMSYKPGGFVIGAGHGNTFADNYGNYWNTGTCKISVKDRFERRIDMFPAGFDKDDVMYSITSYGDFPTLLPNNKRDQTKGAFSGWMLLSYKKAATVSSSEECMDVQTHRVDTGGKKVFEKICYNAQNLTDEDIQSYWSAKTDKPGEWLQIDLGRKMRINALQINYADHKATQHNKAMDIYYQYQIFMSDDNQNWTLVVDKSKSDKDAPHDYLELTKPIEARYVKMVNIHNASGLFAVSDFRVFGNGLSEKPKSVTGFKVSRSVEDSRNAMINWDVQPGAVGYNIYYGIAPDKLYNSIMVYEGNSYDFRGLDKGTGYYFAIEAFNENGIGPKTNLTVSN